MKTNAIIRIVLFSLGILILTAILLTALGFKFFIVDTNLITTEEYPLPVVSDGYHSSGSANADAIRNLDIEWVAGTITITPQEDIYEIIATENCGNEKYQMVYAVSGDTLKIQFCEDSIKFPSFGINYNFSKDLHITVPSSWRCDELSIDAAASDVTINTLNVNEVDFDGASGQLSFHGCNVFNLDIDTASGDVEFDGTLENLDFEAASASFHGTVHNCPTRLLMDSLSGKLNLSLPSDCGFTLYRDSLTGSFSSDFEIIDQGGARIHGDGSCRIEVSGLSGNVNINKHHTDSPADCTDPNCTDTSHKHQSAKSTQTHHNESEHH